MFKTLLRNQNKSFWLLILLIVVIISGIISVNYRLASQIQLDNEFRRFWTLTRNFILNGISPYQADELSLNSLDLMDTEKETYAEEQFIFPIYSTFLTIPFSIIPNYALARSLWMTFVEISIITFGYLLIRNLGWEIKTWMLPIFFIFLIFFFPSFFAIVSGDLSIPIVLCMVICLSAIQRDSNLVAGLFLSLSTMRPRLSLFFIIVILFWGISKRNWSLLRWFLIWLALFISAGLFFLPDWPLQYLRVIIRNGSITSPGSLGNILLWWLPGIGSQLRWLTILILLVILIYELWQVKNKEFRHLLWVTGLSITISLLIGFASNVADSVLIIISLTLIFSIVDDRYHNFGTYVVIFSMLAILIGSWALAVVLSRNLGQISIFTGINLTLSLFVLLGLYWTRWWLIKPALGQLK